MRLICPNCDAQYEVDASAVPPTGRDVQCSNCGHAWFQEPDSAPEAQPEPASEPARDAYDDAMIAKVAQPVANAPVTQDNRNDPDLAAALADGPAVVKTPRPDLPPRPEVDESILAILREEADREAIARRADAATLEMQGELGLASPAALATAPPRPIAPPEPAPFSDTEKRLAAIKGQPLPSPKPAARRDLLPDIEEINSSLSPNAAATRDLYDENDHLPDLTDAKSRRSGFGSGFVLMLIVAGVGAALYMMAPQVSQQFPAAADAMTGYVAAVDAARSWLDGLIRQATGALNGFTGNDGA